MMNKTTKVLIIDDEVDQREQLDKLIDPHEEAWTRIGVAASDIPEIRFAVNGNELIEKIKDGSCDYDVIIADVIMANPKDAGAEAVYDALQRLPSPKRVYFVATTRRPGDAAAFLSRLRSEQRRE